MFILTGERTAVYGGRKIKSSKSQKKKKNRFETEQKIDRKRRLEVFHVRKRYISMIMIVNDDVRE